GLVAGVRSTSNTLHVPRPITGNFSPDDGIERVSIADDSALASIRDAVIGKRAPAMPAPIMRAASRRVISARIALPPFSECGASVSSRLHTRLFSGSTIVPVLLKPHF